MQEVLARQLETAEQHGQQINSMSNMLSSPHQFRLSSYFPPRVAPDPIFPNPGTLPMTYGLLEAKELPALKLKIQLDRLDALVSQLAKRYMVNTLNGTEVSGTKFVEDQSGKSEEKSMADAIAEFHKLKQVGSVREYQDRFEELRSLMLILQPTLTERYFVSNFISGLKDELRLMVKMMMPATVKEAAEKARLQELALEAIFRKHGLQPNESMESSKQIEGASKVANYDQQESKKNLELDRPIITENSNNKERSDMDISENHSLYLQEADGVASEDEEDIADRFHANDERQPHNEDLDQRKKQEAEDLHNPTAAENNHVVQKMREKEAVATRFRSLDIGEGIVDMEILEVSIEDEEGEEMVKMGIG